MMAGVNMVNAPVLARERGIDVREVARPRSEYQTLVRVTVDTDEQAALGGRHAVRRRPAAHRRNQGHPGRGRFRRHMLYVTNQDKPGFIGRFGARWPGPAINIATFHLGRAEAGGDAICWCRWTAR